MRADDRSFPGAPGAELHRRADRDEGWEGRKAGGEAGGRDARGSLRFGVVTGYPTEDPSSRSLLEACARLGTTVTIPPASLAVRVGRDRWDVLSAGDAAAGLDVVLLLRGMGPGGDADAQLTAYRLLERGGSLVMNSLPGLLAAQDKLETSALLARAGIPTPPVVLVQAESDLDEALRFLGSAVAKPQWGSLGDGVELLAPGEEGRARAAALLDAQGSLHLQAFVDHGGRDLRALVVGSRVVAAMERRAPEGELRTNLRIGGSARPIAIGVELERIAVGATHVLGLDWAGVDIAIGPGGPTVIEVNGSPGWDGIQRTTGRDIGEAIAMHAARRARERIEHDARTEGG